jgi:hypothetical protein
MHHNFNAQLYFYDSSLLQRSMAAQTCKNHFCDCQKCKLGYQQPTLNLTNFYQVTPIHPIGYRLEWWGDDGTHFWDYRKFETVDETQVTALMAIAQYAFNGDCGEAYPINNDLSQGDTFYRLWLICTSWEDALELIDPHTNEIYRFPLRHENASKLAEIERAKDWIDAFEAKRKPVRKRVCRRRSTRQSLK